MNTALWESCITRPKPPAQGCAHAPQITLETHTLAPPVPHTSQPSPRRKPGRQKKTQRRGWDPGLLSQQLVSLDSRNALFWALLAQSLAHCRYLDLSLFTLTIYNSLVWRSCLSVSRGATLPSAVSTRLGCCCCYVVASVVSDSVRPHRRQPPRLCRPWGSPGKNTGVGYLHYLSVLHNFPDPFLGVSLPLLHEVLKETKDPTTLAIVIGSGPGRWTWNKSDACLMLLLPIAQGHAALKCNGFKPQPLSSPWRLWLEL